MGILALLFDFMLVFYPLKSFIFFVQTLKYGMFTPLNHTCFFHFLSPQVKQIVSPNCTPKCIPKCSPNKKYCSFLFNISIYFLKNKHYFGLIIRFKQNTHNMYQCYYIKGIQRVLRTKKGPALSIALDNHVVI